MIIDSHCHVWPDKVAPRALAGSIEGAERFGDGRVASLIETMDAAGIDRAVCLGIANQPERLESANRFVGSLDRERFIGFGTIHPGAPVEANVEGLRRNGLRGAKVHPYFQGYALDDPDLWRIFEAMEGEFAVIMHVGIAGEDPGERCTPAMAAAIADAFPGLALIACHFGGYWKLEDAEEVLIGKPNVYLDTSWPPRVEEIGAERIRSLIERHGEDRVLFASDWPMADPAAERATLEGLGLGAEATANLLGGNFLRLLAERTAAPR
jgi:predicted TIM-barrel fold metal-dependent hydrolase